MIKLNRTYALSGIAETVAKLVSDVGVSEYFEVTRYLPKTGKLSITLLSVTPGKGVERTPLVLTDVLETDAEDAKLLLDEYRILRFTDGELAEAFPKGATADEILGMAPSYPEEEKEEKFESMEEPEKSEPETPTPPKQTNQPKNKRNRSSKTYK